MGANAVLICGTGIGMAISANKVANVRAAVCHDSYSAERSIRSNNCQVLAFGTRVVGVELARKILSEWLDHEFDPTSASAAKVARITAHEATSLHYDKEAEF
jgi:ribose 5-phosphate isomerase B